MRESNLTYEDDLEEDEDLMEDMYLTFSVHNRDFGLDIESVVEIVVLQHITEVPDMPKFVKGVVNLRGKVIPLIDIRERFHLPEQDYHDRTCVIIMEASNMRVGLIVDSVSEVLRIDKKDMEPSPKIGNNYSSRFVESVAKVGSEVKIILNLDKLLNEKEISEISTATSISLEEREPEPVRLKS